MTTSTLPRFVAINSALSTSDTYCWHLFDRETREVAVWYTSETRATELASDCNDDPSRRVGLLWTDFDDLDDEQIINAARAAEIAPGSDEFWAEAQLVADAAGYCEVFDRLAYVLGGPVREGARDGLDRDHFRVTIDLHLPKGQITDLYDLRQVFRNALRDLPNVRVSTNIKAERTEPTWAREIRERMAELRASRATETAE